jgi:ubiquinone/menaquinone biosynthesis C-methylase UbiE
MRKHNTREILNTRGSFDYQWRNIPEGAYLLPDDRFKGSVGEIILDEMDTSRERLEGLLVLDAGCGNGRWTYGFLKLGCRVVALDYARSGCVSTKYNTKEFQHIHVIVADILHIPLREEVFDVVFCWGVLHHTGDIERSFQNVSKPLKRGGVLHIYVYGPKALRVKILRKVLSLLSYDSRLALIRALTPIINRFPKLRVVVPLSSSVHSSFDVYSPSINDESSEGYIASLFKKNGFKSVRRMYPRWCNAKFSQDIHMQGEKL